MLTCAGEVHPQTCSPLCSLAKCTSTSMQYAGRAGSRRFAALSTFSATFLSAHSARCRLLTIWPGYYYVCTPTTKQMLWSGHMQKLIEQAADVGLTGKHGSGTFRSAAHASQHHNEADHGKDKHQIHVVFIVRGGGVFGIFAGDSETLSRPRDSAFRRPCAIGSCDTDTAYYLEVNEMTN